jgi:hypothetical protein
MTAFSPYGLAGPNPEYGNSTHVAYRESRRGNRIMSRGQNWLVAPALE